MSATLAQISSAVRGVGQIATGVGGLASGIGNLASGLGGASIGLGGYAALISSSQAGSWLSQLQPASYRGLPFAVEREEVTRGRRTAVHTYPFRDKVWGEDTGRGPRTYAITGFVVGDDCYAQALALLTAAEVPGPGTLVHPWLGTAQVAQTAQPRAGTRKELGRVVELQFEFVESADPIYPSAATDTQSQVATASSNASAASASGFASQAGSALQQGAQVVQAGASTVQSFARQATALVGDASLITHAVAGLSPPAGFTYGRYAYGSRSTLLQGISTVSGAISAATLATAAVGSAANSAVRLTNLL